MNVMTIRMSASRVALWSVLVAAVSLLPACEPAVPDNPTWTEDVRPILMSNCVRCHTDPPIAGAPGYLRLDRYDNWPLDDGTMAVGAAAVAPNVTARVLAGTMPPVFNNPLTGRQQEILELWSDNGAPYGPDLPGNVAPEITVEAPVVDMAARTATMDYTIRDPDGDYVLGFLNADDAESFVVTSELHSGPGQVIWDFSAVPAGSYAISAVLDDGNHQDRFTIDLGITIEVPAIP